MHPVVKDKCVKFFTNFEERAAGYGNPPPQYDRGRFLRQSPGLASSATPFAKGGFRSIEAYR